MEGVCRSVGDALLFKFCWGLLINIELRLATALLAGFGRPSVCISEVIWSSFQLSKSIPKSLTADSILQLKRNS